MTKTLRAVCTRLPVRSELDEGEFRIVVLRDDGSVANTGRRFASLADARLFGEGLDMAARLFGARCLFEDVTRRVCDSDWNAFAADLRCSVDTEDDGARCGHCRREEKQRQEADGAALDLRHRDAARPDSHGRDGYGEG